MEYDAEFLKKQLSLQGITTTDDDIHHVQRVLSIIRNGERYLEQFPDLESQKTALTLDLEH